MNELIKKLEELSKSMKSYNVLEIRTFGKSIKTLSLEKLEAGLIELAVEEMLEDLKSELGDEDE